MRVHHAFFQVALTDTERGRGAAPPFRAGGRNSFTVVCVLVQWRSGEVRIRTFTTKVLRYTVEELMSAVNAVIKRGLRRQLHQHAPCP